jgi:hypothetical protein
MTETNSPRSTPSRSRQLGLTCLRAVLSVLAGLAVALMLNYLLYRVGLPSKPFIYVAF